MCSKRSVDISFNKTRLAYYEGKPAISPNMYNGTCPVFVEPSQSYLLKLARDQDELHAQEQSLEGHHEQAEKDEAYLNP